MKIVFIVAILLSSLVIYDLTYGKKSSPSFYTAPQAFCDLGWAGITAPPIGVFLCSDSSNDNDIKAHELEHWKQYQRMGTLTFYGNYIVGWIVSGFSYENNWMEKEANNTSQGNAL